MDLTSRHQDVDVYIGRRRTAVLRMGAPMRVGKSHKLLLAHLEPRVTQVVQAMSFSHADITGALSDRVRLSPGSKESLADSMRSFKSSPGKILYSPRPPPPLPLWVLLYVEAGWCSGWWPHSLSYM